MLENEKVYKSNAPVKYYFEKGNENHKHLLVIFSGFAENDSKLKHKYNYIYALKDIKCHKLFILDDKGETGSYYLGEKLDFDVETSVLSLILYKASILDIPQKNIITLGSSKGGSAALYYGLKYKFGNILAGAFQTRISDLIKMRRPECQNFLLGKSTEDGYEERFERLNNIIFDQLEEPILSNLYLMSSENDWQYEPHVQPFIRKLDDKGIKYHFDKSEEIQNHNEISLYFPRYFRLKLLEILYDISINKLEIENDESIIINTDYTNRSHNRYKLHFISKVGRQEVIHKNAVEFSPEKPGYYTTYLMVTDTENNELYRNVLSQKFFSAGQYDINSIQFDIIDNILTFSIETTDNDNLTFAFYIVENGKVSEKIMYQKDNTVSRQIKPGHNYYIQYYIRSKDSHTVVNNTELIKN